MKPTKAQIEVAARAIFENMSDIDGDEADWILLQDDCIAGAKAALTAAAEVERYTPATAKDIWDEAKRATIERCAQVVNSYDGSLMDSTRKNLIAAIRALKDEGLPTAEDVRGILKEKP